MGNKWFTADWHAGEESRLNTHSFLRPRPTGVMVKEWLADCRAKIKPQDTLVFVGDLGIQLSDLGVFRALPECERVLVLGDKETESKHFTLDEFQKQNAKLGIFDQTYDHLYTEVAGQGFFLAHKPTDCLSQPTVRPAICGHVHGIWRTQPMPSGQPIINVGIDAWGGVVSEEMIAHQYDCITRGYYDDNCRPATWT